MNFSVEQSYRQQAQHEDSGVLPSCYTRPDSIDNWRRDRMLNATLPLVRAFPAATWMTVGDGRYGSDAFFLQNHGVDVTATSLTGATLKIAAERNYIRKYRLENAEQLSAADNAFNFVLCKESYHHFPRPPVAFYEMLRVASQAVVLIEPIEGPARAVDFLKQVVKRTIRGDRTSGFEPAGNFVYRTTTREIEKMVLALGGTCLAVKNFNDFYLPQLRYHSCRTLSAATVLTTLGLWVQDALCGLGLMNYGLAAMIVFKTAIDAQLKRELARAGFRVLELPQNPYH